MWAALRYIFMGFSLLVKKFTEPLNQSVIVNLNGVYYPVSYWTEKGGRPYQEDRYDVLKGRGADDSSLYGVFDGHGGDRAAQYCKSHMLSAILADEMFESNPAEAMTKCFHRIDREFMDVCKSWGYTDGTTAVVAQISNRHIVVANAGDSRCMVVQKGGQAHALSVDHKPSREDEEQRIRDLGGKVIFWGRWRVEGVLAVSRAIGDIKLKPYVTCDPEIQTKEITDDDLYMVLASDGLWDVMTNEEVASFVVRNCQRQEFKHIARDLCYEATLLGSTDNVTVQVVDLRRKVSAT